MTWAKRLAQMRDFCRLARKATDRDGDWAQCYYQDVSTLLDERHRLRRHLAFLFVNDFPEGFARRTLASWLHGSQPTLKECETHARKEKTHAET